MSFGIALAGRRCQSGLAAAAPIEVISSGVRLRVALVFLADAPSAMRNSVTGVRWLIGQDAMGVTVAQNEPCQIMARVSERAVLVRVAHAVGTSGQRFR